MSDQTKNQPSTSELSDILQVRRDKLSALRESGADPFLETQFDKTHSSAEILAGFDTLEGQTVRLAGRLVSKRVMGKASFSHIQDFDGKIQLYVRRDVLGDDPYAGYKKFDIGDIIGVVGDVFKTNAGEISIKASEIKLLAKSLTPLPEKYHGLKDTDLRYRQRYVDLIVNPDVKRTFKARSKMIKTIRDYLDTKGYVEVETPILMGSAGGRGCTSIYYTSQHTRSRHVSAYRNRASS